MKRYLIFPYITLLISTVLISISCYHIYTDTSSSHEEVEYKQWDWYNGDSILKLSLVDIHNWYIPNDAAIVICTYKNKDIAFSCRAFDHIFYNESTTVYRNKYGEYVLQEELKY